MLIDAISRFHSVVNVKFFCRLFCMVPLVVCIVAEACQVPISESWFSPYIGSWNEHSASPFAFVAVILVIFIALGEFDGL